MSVFSEFIGGFAPYFRDLSTWFNERFPWTANFFLLPVLLLSLLCLIIFVMIYLIRPKPKDKTIPSLMFFFAEKGRSKLKSFFRKFVSEPLFLLQLLILLFMCAAAAKPYVHVPETAFIGSSIVIVDGSASMQVGSRFSDAVDFASDHLGQRNSVIIASDRPKVLGEKTGKREAKSLLDSASPDDTETNLVSAALIASNYLERGTNIFIISDFVDPRLDQLKTAANILESQGAKVFFHQVGSPGKNIGIVELEVTEKKSKMRIRNYNANDETVRIKVNEELIDTKTIAALSSELVTFNTPAGLTKVSLDVKDDFSVDNTIFISTPKQSTNSVLVITNDDGFQSSLFDALLQTISQNSTTKLDISISNPPKVPNIYQDLVILKDVSPTVILPGTIDSIKRRVEQGGALLIIVQEALFQIDFKGLNPVDFIAREDSAYVNKVGSSLTKDLDFGEAAPFFKVSAKEGVSPIAVADNPDLNPVIAYGKYGNGLIAYYGIFDESSEFLFEPRYPIFWKDFINILLKKPNIESLNQRTGAVISYTQPLSVKTPKGTVRDSVVTLDRVGFYESSEKDVGANLLSERESTINMGEEDLQVVQREFESVKEQKPLDLSKYFIIAALVFLFIELLYIKYRGDF